jgi:hypothetical protein
MRFVSTPSGRCSVPFGILLSAVLWANIALGYGPIGHQIVGAIADEKLATSETGKKVTALLDGMTLEKVSVIPDEIRGWDKNGPDDPGIFHYSAHPGIDAQLRVDLRMRGIMKRGGIIRAVLVPASDFVWNCGRLLQRDPVQQRGDPVARRSARQLLVGDRADDFVADRAVSASILEKKKRAKRDCDFKIRSHVRY